MPWRPSELLGAALAAAAIVVAGAMPTANAASERALFVAVGAQSRPPVGWVEFCNEYARECDTKPMEPRDAVFTPKAWKDLLRIVISTDGSKLRREEARELNVNLYVEKPFRPEVVRDVLCQIASADPC